MLSPVKVNSSGKLSKISFCKLSNKFKYVNVIYQNYLDVVSNFWAVSWVATLFWLRVVRIKRCGGSGFGGAAVLVGSSGDQVSFKTTEGGVLLKDKLDWRTKTIQKCIEGFI
jgi:hypothetical protein